MCVVCQPATLLVAHSPRDRFSSCLKSLPLSAGTAIRSYIHISYSSLHAKSCQTYTSYTNTDTYRLELVLPIKTYTPKWEGYKTQKG
ncbi:hypothetical protein XELAEV_18041845mg [Xenopus laevis]|uniref:Uncharacterized protein n=1 Tax=Xenopus laevis TaxID=8355 RepID=A0A974C342_XENLA|nr:hypothetical protein XELAEV_18041845mg [Xenopus laevis]